MPRRRKVLTPMSAVSDGASPRRTHRVCARCGGVLMGPARTCLVHGDQLDVGGRAPALETVADQLRKVPRR